MSHQFWKGKRVLITGARGFFGCNLSRELLDQGALVYVVVTGRKTNNKIFLEMLNRFALIHEGDICNYEDMARLFQDNKIDTCFHLAAQPIVGTAFDSPLLTFDINIKGTINILEAARCAPTLQRLIIASSTHVYGDNPSPPFLESFYPRPSRPYETSKACADLLAQTYHYTFGLPVAIARPTNTFGPGDLNFSRLVPKVMQSILEGTNPELFNSTAVRDYIYIKDCVKGYMRLGEELGRPEVQGQAFNFGSGSVYSATKMAQLILDINGKSKMKIRLKPANISNEITRQYVSTEKAKTLLGWEPSYQLGAALKETYTWYNQNHLRNSLQS